MLLNVFGILFGITLVLLGIRGWGFGWIKEEIRPVTRGGAAMVGSVLVLAAAFMLIGG